MSGQATHFLDRWPARLIAFLIAIGIGGLLYKISPDLSLDLATMPQGAMVMPASIPNDPAFEACLSNDKSAIDKMREEGLVDDAKAMLFLSRAEARCRATTSQ